MPRKTKIAFFPVYRREKKLPKPDENSRVAKIQIKVLVGDPV